MTRGLTNAPSRTPDPGLPLTPERQSPSPLPGVPDVDQVRTSRVVAQKTDEQWEREIDDILSPSHGSPQEPQGGLYPQGPPDVTKAGRVLFDRAVDALDVRAGPPIGTISWDGGAARFAVEKKDDGFTRRAYVSDSGDRLEVGYTPWGYAHVVAAEIGGRPVDMSDPSQARAAVDAFERVVAASAGARAEPRRP